MSEYIVNIGVSLTIKSDDPDEAEEMAVKAFEQTYGLSAKDFWISVEDIF